jgi:predicted esterase
MLKFVLIFELFYLISSSSDIILEPIKQGANNAALIFIPGAELPPERYVPLLKQTQLTSTDSLWVAIPSFPDNIPIEQLRPKVIDEMLTKLHKSGMLTNTTIFLGGHSLGGIASQTLAYKYPNKVFGQILIGAYLERKYETASTIYPVPTLTLSGELDGLARVTRIIESFYFYSTYPHFTLIIPGMNHMNTASGEPSGHILKNDIQSEINETIAHQQLSIRICDYINMRLNNQTMTSMLEYNLNQTKIFSQPYLNALSLEGFYHFLPPCYNQTNDNCQIGSPWSAYGQKILSGLNDTVQLNISDEFHIVYKIPEHFAHLDNNCSFIKPLNNCVLNIHTVTQNIYDLNDQSDTGETHTSAEEMRVKMISRQVLLQAADGKKYDFNQTDNQSLCGLVNQQALNWALKNAANKTKDRYERIGKKMFIGDDIGPLNAGPLWIWTPLVRIYQINVRLLIFLFCFYSNMILARMVIIKQL